MDNEPSPENAEVTPLPGRSRSQDGQESDPQGSPVYDALIRQYGEAMLKIGRLEAQVGHLVNQLPRSNTPPGDLAAGVGLPEKTSRSPQEHSSLRGSQVEVPHERENNEELRQLRLQITSLANQLDQTEDQLTQVIGHRVPRPHRRVKHRPWWKKMARRLGLRRSRGHKFEG